VGVDSSLSSWLQQGRLDRVQIVLAVYTVAAVAMSLMAVAAGDRPMLRWVAGFWLVLACFTGAGVWGIPTNVARAFSILWPLGLLSLFARRRTLHFRESGSK